MSILSRVCVLLTVVALLSGNLGAAVQGTDQEQARQILDAAAVKGGLVVHVGCGDGRLTAALCINDSYIVHGLDRNPANVAAARC